MSVRDYELTFTGSGEQPIQATGRFLRVLEASTDIYIKIDHSTELKRRQGSEVALPEKYRVLAIRSDVAQTVRISVSDIQQQDNQQTVAVNATATVSVANNNQHQPEITITATSSAQLVAGNANRKQLRVAIKSSEAGGVYLGKAGISAGNGGYLEEGMVDYLETEGEVWAYNNNSSSVTVSVLELERI